MPVDRAALLRCLPIPAVLFDARAKLLGWSSAASGRFALPPTSEDWELAELARVIGDAALEQSVRLVLASSAPSKSEAQLAGRGRWSREVTPVMDDGAQLVGALAAYAPLGEDRADDAAHAALESASGTGWFEYNPQTGAHFASRSMRALFLDNPDAGDFSFEDWAGRVHPEDLDRVQESFQRALDPGGDGRHVQYRVQTPGGQWKWLDVRGHTYFAGEAAQRRAVRHRGAVRDITDLKRAEDELRASEERLRRALRKAPVPVAILAEDGEVLFLNDVMLEALGKEAANVRLVEDWARLMHPDDLEKAQAAMQAAAVSDEAVNAGDLRLRTSAGEERIWNSFAAPMGRRPDGRQLIVSMSFDVTERRRIADELRRSESKFRSILDANGIPTFFWRVDGAVTDANDAWLELTGYSREQVRRGEVNWRDLTPPEYMSHDARALAEILARGRQQPYEKELLTPGGKIPVVICGAALLGNRREGVAFVVDLSRQKSSEAALRELNESLERRVQERTVIATQRLEQLRVLATQLSAAEQHERRRIARVLHDHLQQILVAAKMALEAVDEVASRETIDDAIGRALGMIDQSIAASRSLAVELCPPILYDRGLGEALVWLGQHIQKQHGLNVVVQVPSFLVLEDEDIESFLYQAAHELLLNVVKHAQTERVDVELSEQRGKEIVLRVQDGGVGFDPEQLLLTGAGAGDSFGLLTLRQRTTLLGGDFRLVSRPGQGCQIQLRVPWPAAPDASA